MASDSKSSLNPTVGGGVDDGNVGTLVAVAAGRVGDGERGGGVEVAAGIGVGVGATAVAVSAGGGVATGGCHRLAADVAGLRRASATGWEPARPTTAAATMTRRRTYGGRLRCLTL